MKNLKSFSLMIAIVIAIFVMNLIVLSCKGSDDDDNDDSSGSDCSSVAYEQDACDYILSVGSSNSDQTCVSAYDWSFTSAPECRDGIQALLASTDACDQSVGECLNTMFKYGLISTDENGNPDCGLVTPHGCDEAWQVWNDCLALADSGDC